MFNRKKTIFKRSLAADDREIAGKEKSPWDLASKQLSRLNPFDGQEATRKNGDNGAQNHNEKLNRLVIGSNNALFSCKAVFPFDLFPDKISVESVQVNIYKCIFFYTHSIISLPIRNLIDVTVDAGPFFATLSFIDNSFAPNQNVIKVHYLKRGDAQKVRRIVQGLIIVTKEDVDLSHVTAEDLINTAESIGRAEAIE